MDENKKKAIDLTIKQIDKTFGKGALSKDKIFFILFSFLF